MPRQRLAGAVESALVVALNSSEKRSDLAGPRHGRELVDRGDHETGKPAINRLIDGQDRQGVSSAEGTVTVYAGDAQIGRRVGIGEQLEGVPVELRAAPRAFFERDRRGLAV